VHTYDYFSLNTTDLTFKVDSSTPEAPSMGTPFSQPRPLSLYLRLKIRSPNFECSRQTVLGTKCAVQGN